MSRLTDNPALALRAALAPHTAGCFLRWDRRARALLVSDAPRRGVTAPGRLGAERPAARVDGGRPPAYRPERGGLCAPAVAGGRRSRGRLADGLV